MILAIPAAGLIVIGFRADWSSGLAGLQRAGVALAVVAAAAVVVKVWRACSSRGRQIVLPIRSTGQTRLAARHEAGHYAVGKAVGARVDYAVIWDCGAGYTALTMPRNATPAENIAVDVAGHVAAGSASGCSGGIFDSTSDFAWMRRHLREVPKKQRAAVKREGYALARKICKGWGSPVPSLTRTLLRDGRVDG